MTTKHSKPRYVFPQTVSEGQESRSGFAGGAGAGSRGFTLRKSSRAAAHEGWAGAGGPASRMTHDYCSYWLQADHSGPVVFSIRLLEFLHSMAAGFLVE